MNKLVYVNESCSLHVSCVFVSEIIHDRDLNARATKAEDACTTVREQFLHKWLTEPGLVTESDIKHSSWMPQLKSRVLF